MLAAVLAGCGLGILGPPLFQILQRNGSPASAAAATLAAAAAWALSASSVPAALAAAAAGTLASALLILPASGELGALFAASAALAAAFLRRKPAAAAPGGGTPPAAAVLAVVAACGWTRCLSLLVGHWLYGVSIVLGAALAGVAAGKWAERRLRFQAQNWNGPLALAVAGAAGILFIYFLSFLGFNTGEAERLDKTVLGTGDFLFLHAQAGAALTVWWGLLGYAAANAPPEAERGDAASLVSPMSPASTASPIIGAVLGWLALRHAGGVLTAGLACLGLMGRGAFLLRRTRPAHPMLRPCLAGIILGVFLVGRQRDLFKDVWLNRLNNAFPGGEFLFFHDDGNEALGVYRFASRAPVVLSDGTASYQDPAAARRAVHQTILLHSRPKSILLLGTRRPETILSALAHGIAVTAADSHPSLGKCLEALDRARVLESEEFPGKSSKPPWPPAEGAERLTLTRTRPGRLPPLAAPPDVILLEPIAPLRGPRAALQTTRDAFRRMRSALAPGGLAAVRLTGALNGETVGRVASSLAAEFPYLGALPAPGGLLLIAAEAEPRPGDWKRRLTVAAQLDDLALESDLMKEFPRPEFSSLRRVLNGEPQTDRLPLNAFGY